MADTLLYQLLPIAWRRVHHDGVRFEGLLYDGPELNPIRGRPSPYLAAGGKWPFHYDDNDVSRIYMCDPATNEWAVLRWVHRLSDDEPFPDAVRDHAKDLVRKRNGNLSNHPDLERVLNDLIERLETGVLNGREELQLARRHAARSAQTRRDYATSDQPAEADVAAADEPDPSSAAILDDIEPMGLLADMEEERW